MLGSLVSLIGDILSLHVAVIGVKAVKAVKASGDEYTSLFGYYYYLLI